MIIPTQRRMQPQTLAQAPTPQVDQDRKQQMQQAWKAYSGEFQPPLKVEPNQPDDNVISNRCAPIVDKGVSFLFGQTLKIEVTDEATDADDEDDTPSPMQDFLDGLWGDDDDRMTLLSKMAINGGAFGQVFVKIIPPQGTMRYPRIVNLDPRIVRIVTDPEDCDLHLAYIIEYPGTNDLQKRQIIARVDPDGLAAVAGPQELDDTWTITNYLRKGQLGSWLQVGESEEWPYPFAPILTCQNLPNPNEAWGKPDLTPDLINQNKVLNFIQSNTSRIIKYHGHPITFATGVQASQISISVDDVLCLPAPDSKLEKLAAHSDLGGLLNFAAVVRDDMDEQSRVPSVALGRLESLPKGNISGVALQLLFQPLIEKTVMKQRLYGKLIREICRAVLVIAELISVEQFEDYKIEVHWQNLLPVDDLAAAQTGLLLVQLGVSQATVQQQLGYNPDDEAEKKAQEDAQKMVNYSRGVGLPPSSPPDQQPQAGQAPTMQQQGGQA